jgi:copper(I)-binding protein
LPQRSLVCAAGGNHGVISMNRMTMALVAALSLLTGAAAAEDYTVAKLRIANPWTRATPRGADIAGAYMTIRNTGTEADRLVSGSSAVAGRFEIHQMSMDKGVMKMRPLDGGLEIKPGQSVEFKPGSFHVMLTGLKQQLEKGQRVKATLEFEKAGKVDIEFAVEAVGASAPAAKAPAGAHTGH